MAFVRRKAGKLGEARNFLEEAVKFHEKAVALSPHHPQLLESLLQTYWELANIQGEMGDHKAVAATALAIAKPRPGGKPSHVASAAMLLANCVPLVEGDARLSEP